MPKDSKALYLFSVISALLLAASYHPLDLGFLAWLALIPFLFVLQGSSFGKTAGLSFVFGYIYGAAIFHWLPAVEGVGWPIFLLTISPV